MSGLFVTLVTEYKGPMPSLRFVCDDWFEATCDSPNIPRIGERVVLLEHGLKVNYRVREITWNLVESEAQGCRLDVDRLRSNPCTKCKQYATHVMAITEMDYSITGWECKDCNYSLHNGGRPLTAEDIERDKHDCAR